MADDANVEFYNKYMQVMKSKLDKFLTDSLSLEAQLIIAKEQVLVLREENEKLEKKIKSLGKKADS